MSTSFAIPEDFRRKLNEAPGRIMPFKEKESKQVYFMFAAQLTDPDNAIEEYLPFNGTHHLPTEPAQVDELNAMIQAGIDSGSSIPAEEVFAELKEKAAQLNDR